MFSIEQMVFVWNFLYLLLAAFLATRVVLMATINAMVQSITHRTVQKKKSEVRYWRWIRTMESTTMLFADNVCSHIKWPNFISIYSPKCSQILRKYEQPVKRIRKWKDMKLSVMILFLLFFKIRITFGSCSLRLWMDPGPNFCSFHD